MSYIRLVKAANSMYLILRQKVGITDQPTRVGELSHQLKRVLPLTSNIAGPRHGEILKKRLRCLLMR